MNLRKYKIYNMALFDYFITFVFVFFIHLYMWRNPLYMDITTKNNRNLIQYISSFILLFISFIGIAVIFHYIFGIKSGLSAHLGFNNIPDKNR